MSLRVHGIDSCDTCRRARAWLERQGVRYQWIDLRSAPVPVAEFERWLSAVGSRRLVNRRSAAWRRLPEARRPAPDADERPGLLAECPTLVKRPLFRRGDEVRVGFDDEVREWLRAN